MTIIFIYALSTLETQQQWGNGQSTVRTHLILNPYGKAWSIQNWDINTSRPQIRNSGWHHKDEDWARPDPLSPMTGGFFLMPSHHVPCVVQWVYGYSLVVCHKYFINVQHDIIHGSTSSQALLASHAPIPCWHAQWWFQGSKQFVIRTSKIAKSGGA